MTVSAWPRRNVSLTTEMLVLVFVLYDIVLFSGVLVDDVM